MTCRLSTFFPARRGQRGLSALALSAALLGLSACGGGAGSSQTPPAANSTPPTTPTAVTGVKLPSQVSAVTATN